MKPIWLSSRNEQFLLRPLVREDASELGRFFNSLSAETRSRFAPHPLDQTFAAALCAGLNEDPADRFILGSSGSIFGYFILDPVVPAHEAERYRYYDIELVPGEDCMFAPCLADSHQDRGLGGQVMPHLIEHCRRKGYRSLVLLGGTQETNALALQFYRKSGFIPLGSFMTEIANIDMRLVV